MFTLPPLRYAYEALEPTVSSTTMHLHHDKHHQRYIDVMNDILSKEGAPAKSLEEVVVEAARDPKTLKLYQNAGQAWNHAFFWCCMSPEKQAPAGALAEAIAADFGDLAKLKETFVAEGVGHFGSGWVWLVAEGGKLKVISTHDADGPLTREGATALLVADLWEHAYYVDYKNDRKGFLEAWFDNVASWAFAGDQLAAANGSGKAWTFADA